MIELRSVSRHFQVGDQQVKALDEVSLAIDDGEYVSIMGPSGSGKSTLLRQMGLLDLPTTGRIFLGRYDVTRLAEGERARLRLKYLGYVFQEYALLGELTAHQNVYLPGMMLNHKGKDYKKRAVESLKLVGLGKRVNHYPKELSGGEQQRVAIARAVANEPPILIADEPTGNLDSELTMDIIRLMNYIHKRGATVIMATHNKDIVERFHKRLISLSRGRIVA